VPAILLGKGSIHAPVLIKSRPFGQLIVGAISVMALHHLSGITIALVHLAFLHSFVVNKTLLLCGFSYVIFSVFKKQSGSALARWLFIDYGQFCCIGKK
jgi:hypothetical protein